ncbi:MAG: ABC transporter permease [Alphaproteobacteria bacterium]
MTAIVHDTRQPGAVARLWIWSRRNKVAAAGGVLVLLVMASAVLAPWLSPHDPLEQSVLNRLDPPSAEFPLGNDPYGRDILSRILWGGRVSLFVSTSAVLIALVVGSAIGILSGYVGGRFDRVVMAAMDVLLSFPSLIMGLLVVAMLGPSVGNLIFAIGLTAVAPFARIARAPTLVIKEREFVEAGRAMGFSHLRIMGVHILPNVASEVMVMGSLWLATAIRTEASLSFIGLGVRPPTPTWGGMIREGFENILDAPWLAVFPSIAILLVMLGLNLLGDGLRDATDPRLRHE